MNMRPVAQQPRRPVRRPMQPGVLLLILGGIGGMAVLIGLTAVILLVVLTPRRTALPPTPTQPPPVAAIVVTPIPPASPTPTPGPQVTHIVEQGQELALIAQRYGVSVADILSYNAISDPNLIYPGQQLVIPAAGEYIPPNPPAPPTMQGRAIVVSTGDQRIYAYENGQLVRTHLVSTGRMVTPTVLGDYRVYVKYTAADMRGPGYFLPQVPYVMYFYQGYGIHGTYWHNSFGRPMSHGCVNLPTPEAEWFFNFASVGTPVRVI